MTLSLIVLLLFSFQQPKFVDCKLVHMADELTLHCDNKDFIYIGSYASWPEQWDAPFAGFSYRAVETDKGMVPVAFTKEEVSQREVQREREYARARAIIEGTLYKRKPLQPLSSN